MYVSLHPDSTWCVVLSHQPTVSLYAGLRQLLKPRDISLQHLLFTLPAAQHGEGVVMWSVMLKKERSRSWQEGQLRNNPCWQKKSGKPYQKFQPLKDKVLKGTVCVSLKVSGSRTRILRSRDPSSKIPQAAIPLATWSLSIRHNAPLYVASWRKNPYHLYQQKTCGLYTICHSRCDIICDIYDIGVCNNSPSQKKLSTFLCFLAPISLPWCLSLLCLRFPFPPLLHEFLRFLPCTTEGSCLCGPLSFHATQRLALLASLHGNLELLSFRCLVLAACLARKV